MSDQVRTVVLAGASRGLGPAAAHVYRDGRRVIAAMRSVQTGLDRLRAKTGVRAAAPLG